MTTLDVVFANLYFSALTAASTGIPGAVGMAAAVEGTEHSGIARIQFALAGMNAHINRDLPDGIVQSFLALGGDPITDDLRERDFDSVNDILERVEEEVKAEFTVGLVGPSIASADRWTMRWRCGRSVPHAAPRGPTRRCCGDCAAFRGCAIGFSTGSTAWWA